MAVEQRVEVKSNSSDDIESGVHGVLAYILDGLKYLRDLLSGYVVDFLIIPTLLLGENIFDVFSRAYSSEMHFKENSQYLSSYIHWVSELKECKNENITAMPLAESIISIIILSIIGWNSRLYVCARFIYLAQRNPAYLDSV